MITTTEKVIAKIDDYIKAVNAARDLFNEDEHRGQIEAAETIKLMVSMLGRA